MENVHMSAKIWIRNNSRDRIHDDREEYSNILEYSYPELRWVELIKRGRWKP
jgi:hypothetical protein